MSLLKRMLFAAFLCLLSNRAFGAILRIEASDEGVLSEDRRSVIIARVEGVWEEKSSDPDDDPIQERAILTPLATIAGNFDPSLHPSVTVSLSSRGFPVTTSIKSGPRPGAIVLAVLRFQVLVHDDPKPRNAIESNNCMFMPERSGMVTIKGLDDPVVQQTLTRIQEGRAKRAKANAKPAADKPKTDK
jgi:hypothetical protein